MLHISREQMQSQAQELKELSAKPSIIYFDEFVKSLTPFYANSVLPDVIKIAKDEDALLAGDFEPLYTINVKENLHHMDYKGFPMWRNQYSDELFLHGLGLIEGNRTDPSNFSLYDTNPHMNIGGATGHGKSVLANSIIVGASMVHPPWLVQLYLSDPKITEMKPYAVADYRLPHVDSVAATSDPEYAISVLEFILAKMDKRASIFTKAGVKNIKSFNEQGLIMPMMVLVLDELKAMLETAGKRAAHVDKLIQAFVAKARFAGGRCIMLSQGVVTELQPSTMNNINIRVALGCTPNESEKLIGNPGASTNLGSMGRIVFNSSPLKTLKENVHIVTPFLPDKANDKSSNIYEIFQHQQEVWEKLTYPGARLAPLSFFDEEAPLTKEEFVEEIGGKVSTDKIFIGEPVYINKSSDKMACINLNPLDEYSDNLGNNILYLSPYARHRLNFLATLLSNFEELRKEQELYVMVSTPLNETNKAIAKLGYQVDSYKESNDVTESFKNFVTGTYVRIMMIKADELIFENRDTMEYKDAYQTILDMLESELGTFSSLNRRRVKAILYQLDELKSRQLFDFSREISNDTKTIAEYYPFIAYIMEDYKSFGFEDKQMTAHNREREVLVFFNFHLLAGTEVKMSNKLDLWMNVVNQAPVYGVHFIIISDMLPTSGSYLNGNFNKIVFYQPINSAIVQHKLGDDYPSSTLECLYIYADKTKTSNKCVKVKYAQMIK